MDTHPWIHNKRDCEVHVLPGQLGLGFYKPIYLQEARHVNKGPCASGLRFKYFNTSTLVGGLILPQAVRENVYGTISIQEDIY